MQLPWLTCWSFGERAHRSVFIVMLKFKWKGPICVMNGIFSVINLRNTKVLYILALCVVVEH
jgi:hypothetical protein